MPTSQTACPHSARFWLMSRCIPDGGGQQVLRLPFLKQRALFDISEINITIAPNQSYCQLGIFAPGREWNPRSPSTT